MWFIFQGKTSTHLKKPSTPNSSKISRMSYWKLLHNCFSHFIVIASILCGSHIRKVNPHLIYRTSQLSGFNCICLVHCISSIVVYAPEYNLALYLKRMEKIAIDGTVLFDFVNPLSSRNYIIQYLITYQLLKEERFYICFVLVALYCLCFTVRVAIERSVRKKIWILI